MGDAARSMEDDYKTQDTENQNGGKTVWNRGGKLVCLDWLGVE